jgi:hypothetical protein
MNTRYLPTRQNAQGETEKQCGQCREFFVANEENFYIIKKKRRNGSYFVTWSPHCKLCGRAKDAERRVMKPRNTPTASMGHSRAESVYAPPPDYYYPDTSANPGVPVYEAPACDALRARFGF